MHADAWSTALFVLGPDRGFDMATRHRLAAYFVERQGDGSFRERQTPAFAALGGCAGAEPDDAGLVPAGLPARARSDRHCRRGDGRRRDVQAPLPARLVRRPRRARPRRQQALLRYLPEPGPPRRPAPTAGRRLPPDAQRVRRRNRRAVPAGRPDR